MQTAKVKWLPISAIRLDFQSAENLIQDGVQEYVDRLRRGQRLLPLTVCFDGEGYFLKDGFHRLEAARRLGIKIEAKIFRGTPPEMEAEWRDELNRVKKCLRGQKRGRVRKPKTLDPAQE